jgi:hypothetical protein|tara:strand:+ start:4178 stop:4405 length:228 start_codon:yes stop_codon:yes gene_type:complete
MASSYIENLTIEEVGGLIADSYFELMDRDPNNFLLRYGVIFEGVFHFNRRGCSITRGNYNTYYCELEKALRVLNP